MSIWRVDRPSNPGNDTEFYSTEYAAKARAKFLQLRGTTHVVAWYDAESTGPFVPPQEAGAA